MFRKQAEKCSNSRCGRVLVGGLLGAAILSFGMAGSASAATKGAGSWRVSSVVMDDVRHVPIEVKGEFRVRARADRPEEVARIFLKKEAQRLKLRDPARDLEVEWVMGPDELGMTHVRFQQVVRGVPVYGAELTVHMVGNVVKSVDGSYLPAFRQSVKTRLSAEAAADLAVDELSDRLKLGEARPFVADRDRGLVVTGQPELIFYNQGLFSGKRTSSVLTWKVEVNRYVFFIDARSGRVVDAYDNVQEALVREVYDANHTTNLPGELQCSGNSCSSSDQEVVDCWNQFGDTWNYFMNEHDWDSWDGQGGTLIGTVNYSEDFVNAYWDGSQMVFGDGMVAEDVTAHELGHGVMQSTANLTYRWQPGALNESFSDVWGAMVDDGDWLIGEDLSIGAIRDMEDPEAYGQPADMDGYKFFFFYDNGGVHINSGIPNHGCYLAAEGGTYNGVDIIGQGREVVGAIWWRTLTTKLTSSAKFSNWATATRSSCAELYGGSNSDTCVQIDNALTAIGL